MTRVRFPHGTQDTSFFEKNAPAGMPPWIPTCDLDDVRYPFIESVAALTYFANLSSLELHTPQWQTQECEAQLPDRVVIDLDPGKPAGLSECASVALVIKDVLDSLEWPSVAVTSGSKGMQVYAAVDGRRSSEEIREWARTVAIKLAALDPQHVTATMATSARPGKVFFDWSQNVAHKTTITPWSLRGKDRPFVALPRTWDEIERGAGRVGVLEQADLDEVLSERLDAPDPMDALTA